VQVVAQHPAVNSDMLGASVSVTSDCVQYTGFGGSILQKYQLRENAAERRESYRNVQDAARLEEVEW
jgi:hypothetical protein